MRRQSISPKSSFFMSSDWSSSSARCHAVSGPGAGMAHRLAPTPRTQRFPSPQTSPLQRFEMGSESKLRQRARCETGLKAAQSKVSVCARARGAFRKAWSGSDKFGAHVLRVPAIFSRSVCEMNTVVIRLVGVLVRYWNTVPKMFARL